MKKSALFIFLGILLIAGTAQAVTLGEMSAYLLRPTEGLAKVMHAISYIAGAALLMMAAVQYKAHRDNKQQVRLSTPVVFLFLGLVFVFLPFLSNLSESSQFITRQLGQEQLQKDYSLPPPPVNNDSNSGVVQQQSAVPAQPGQAQSSQSQNNHIPSADDDWYQ